MYALLPWKPLSTLLVVIIAATIYVDDLLKLIGGDLLGLIGDEVPDHLIIRYFPVALAVVFTGFFVPTGYWAPWRVVWRIAPRLNTYLFPDLNGIWTGTTRSNWPTIEKLVDTAQSTNQFKEKELLKISDQCDAMAARSPTTFLPFE